MKSKSYYVPSLSSNILWLKFGAEPSSNMIQSQLLGLGPDHSLLCALPDETDASHLATNTSCKGRSLLDGDTYQFETTIREVLSSPPALLLSAPIKITRQTPRLYPRVPVYFSGTIRPISDSGRILAVLPVTLSDLCPTGCQLRVPASAWPAGSIRQVLLTCQLPDSSHSSRLIGRIEWTAALPDLHLGIKFQFSSNSDGAHRDLDRWFTTQRAKLVNTVA